MTYFMARSNFVPCAFVWKDGKTVDFSEIIVVCDIKIGTCSQLNEYMKLMSTLTRSFFDVGPSLCLNIVKLIYLNNH